LSRHAPRNPCFGGSSHPADPLIAEIASGPNAPSLLEFPPADDPRESDDLEALDQHLLTALETDDRRSAEGADGGELRTSTLHLLRAVRLPTMRALRTASLRTLRAVIARTTEEENPQRWAACHLILGTALRLRAYRTHGHRRAHLFIGAARAFDVAFGVYAMLRAGMLDPPNAAPEPSAPGDASRCDANRCGPAYRPLGACVNERDGTRLVAQVIAGPFGENRHLLERAIAYLRLTRSSADTKSWAWVASTNNLACALTLLGSRTPAPSGAAMLREAAHVLHEALQVQARGCRREERASTLINLAETLLSIAERETPHVRLRRMERALTASVAALLAVAPPEWEWLLRWERTDLA
jgi:hypothetical protein